MKIVPSDFPYSNKRHAVRALAALRGTPTYGRPAAYYDHSTYDDHSDPGVWSESAENGITDLLADIRHLCDIMRLDHATLDSHAYCNYVHELHQIYE